MKIAPWRQRRTPVGFRFRKLADGKKNFVGVALEGGVPEFARLPVSVVRAYREEGWLQPVGSFVKVAPAGPPSDPYAKTHLFEEVEEFLIHTVEGTLKYNVTHQPGKYDDPEEVSGKRVDWFYDLELVDG